MKRRTFMTLATALLLAIALLPVQAFAEDMSPRRQRTEEAPQASSAESAPVEMADKVDTIVITNLNTNLMPGVMPWWDTKLDPSTPHASQLAITYQVWEGESDELDFYGPDDRLGDPPSGWPEEGYRYRYLFEVSAKSGCYVTENPTVVINGKSYRGRVISSDEEGSITFYYMYTDLYVTSSYAIPLYRMYNTKTSEHLWTKSAKEYGSAGSGSYADWKAEGVAWYVPTSSSKPVYRLYNTKSGDHHYTTSMAEKDKLVSSGQWRDEGIAFYSATAKDTNTIKVYRVYNSRLKRGQHHYTKSAAERDSLVKNSGWKDEGVGFYGYSSTDPL